MKAKLEALLRQFPHVPRAFSLVWTSARGWTAAWLAVVLAQGTLPIALVFSTQVLVDALAPLAHPGAEPVALRAAVGWGALMAVVLLLGEAMACLAGWIRSVQGELVQDRIRGMIHNQALSLDLACFDSPEFYDRLHRARVDALSRPVALLENAGNLAQNGLTLAAMAAVLTRFGLGLPLLLVASTLPALFVTLRSALRFHEWRQRSTPAVRRAQYLDWLMTQQYSAAELRLFELGPYFEESYQELRGRLRSEQAALKKTEAAGNIAAAAVGVASLAAATAWTASGAVTGRVTPGELALFVQAFVQGQRMMRALLGGAGEFYRNATFLENLFEFLDEPSVIERPDEPDSMVRIARGIRFEGVTFRYPGSRNLALDGFELEIPAGKIVAVVGENGAGKSTLVKLLCRFYDPESGRVLLDGKDLRDLVPRALRRQIAVLFQEPVRYFETAADNIAFGDRAAADREAIEAAAAAAGVTGPIARLPRGFETLLGRWFGGQELSVGEWQRVALARAFLRRASLIVLDEPTSSMDSWAEADWLARFRQLAAGRTAVVVTHRFTTALHADVIHVMRGGRVVESGSHSELLERGGFYALAWRAQMREAAGAPGTGALVDEDCPARLHGSDSAARVRPCG